MDESLLRFLELARQQLGGADARAELGGRQPDDSRLVWYEPEEGFRVVVVFETAPDDAQLAERRLATLTDTFLHSVETPRAARDAAGATELHLDDALRQLSDRAKAVGAVVIDDKSPVLWGTSLDRDTARNVDMLIRAAENSSNPPTPAQTLGRAIARVRQDPTEHLVQEEDFGFVCRSFATIYDLVLGYHGPFTELQAEGAIVRAIQHIENLVLALPPVEPPPPGGRVIRLPRRIR